MLTKTLALEIRRLGENAAVPPQIRKKFSERLDREQFDSREVYIECGALKQIAISVPLTETAMWNELLEAGFRNDNEGAMDLREKTQFLRNSSFETFGNDFISSFQNELKDYKLEHYQRYLIKGPGEKEFVVWYSKKWESIKACLIFDIPAAS
ncbi:MAG: hypothetical protein K2W94_07035 [Alphaproteobacteria bacterium]|nr:hypothetical protein [Alphaproteobacteria bacterium]